MAPISSFRDVVALWKTPADMAADVGAGAWAARKWPQRDFIPPSWWPAIVASQVGAAAGLTTELLSELAARSPPRRRGCVPAEAAE